jgi:hypothetical protein
MQQLCYVLPKNHSKIATWYCYSYAQLMFVKLNAKMYVLNKHTNNKY